MCGSSIRAPSPAYSSTAPPPATATTTSGTNAERRVCVPAEAGEVADQGQDERPAADLVVGGRHEVGGQAGREAADQPEAGP